ncbi:MAG: hypothetical protein QOG72_2445 [Sphingomonadales bacterium]|jgi:hypothetical protein|nr:hypothetical protein [Sphingomonadales bacterium]
MKIIPLTLRAANDFVERHHRHSSRTSNDGGKFAIGLEEDGQLVGVAIVGRPVARMLQQEGTAELLRCCVSLDAPRNACSRLAARAKRVWQLMGGTRLVTYTLVRESGAPLRAAGFILEASVPAAAWSRRSRPRTARLIEEQPKQRWSLRLAEVPA